MARRRGLSLPLAARRLGRRAFSGLARNWLESARRAAPAALAHGAAALGCGMLLLAVGRPIFTDDLWWHLALGRAFAEGGPWLAADPLLFAPAGPPTPASWLADIALASVARAAGFGTLRVLHVAF